MAEYQNTIAERLLDLRQRLGKTLAEVQKDTGITDSLYSFMEKGKRKATPRTIKILSTVYHVSESWLLEGTGEMFTEPLPPPPSPAQTEEGKLTEEEAALLAKFRKFPPEMRAATLQFCDTMLNTIRESRRGWRPIKKRGKRNRKPESREENRDEEQDL